MITLLIFSFLAGLITILSPCILSILPILLAANTNQERYKPVGIIIGLIISFSFFTISLNSLIHATGISPDIFRYTAVVIIIFFGLTLIFPSLENMFSIMVTKISHVGQTLQEKSHLTTTGFLSGLILGSALGLIWTPCAGPILATITVLAATTGATLTTVAMAIAYSTGAALPMLLITYGGSAIVQKISIIKPYTTIIRQCFGVFIIFSALAIAFNKNIGLSVTRYFPSLSVENSPILQKELDMLKKNNTLQESMSMKAPALVGITNWINSAPLSLDSLKGSVILLDFWTYSCINCIRTLPHLKKWYNDYTDKGLKIIGIHTPEFSFEKNPTHVQDAVKRFCLPYPIGLDNDYRTWQAYDNHYWPAHYLIDQHGVIVHKHFGEGNYDVTENIIRQLLDLTPNTNNHEQLEHRQTTPETYLGCARAENYHPDILLKNDQITTYSYKKPLAKNQVGLTGSWLAQSECIISQNNDCTIDINCIGKTVHLVMSSPTQQQITILVNGKKIIKKNYTKDMDSNGAITVQEPRMYDIFTSTSNEYCTLSIKVPANVSVYVFTFD